MKTARVNATMPTIAFDMLKHLAKRDKVPVSRKACELMLRGLEFEEDEALATMMLEKEKVTKTWHSHEHVLARYGL